MHFLFIPCYYAAASTLMLRNIYLLNKTTQANTYMKKILLTSAILLSTASTAHAGFFDFLFGDDEKTAPAAEVTAPAKTAQTVTAPAAPAESSMTETATNLAMGLLPTLTSQLGVTETQAEGGMGSLLQVAKGALSSDEFGQLSQGIPGMDTLLAAAPALGSKSSGGNALSGMLSNAGGMAAGLGAMGKLTEQFEALGLSSDMIMQFANIAISYFSSSDAPEGAGNTGNLLQSGLSSILGQ
tara:strand:- start:396 stop:1118 length:723 start_codon:yes stop_codon:yes gene_type:complete